MTRAIRTAIAVATVLASGCGGRSAIEPDGAGGAAGTGGAGGGGGAGLATDAGADRSSCVAACGTVTGLPVTSGCTFNLPCSPPPGFTGMVVFVDAQLVSRDSTGTEGWNYTDSSTSAFQLYGQACAAVSNGALVDVDYLCEVAYRCDVPASRSAS